MGNNSNFTTVDGLVIEKGSEEAAWFKKNQARIEGHYNPARIDPKHPHAPKSHPLPPGHPGHKATHAAGASLEEQIVALAHQSLGFAGKMTYSEGPDRAMLFHRAKGDFDRAHADCSQLGASILHWLGNQHVTDTDYTGTLLQKARIVAAPAAGLGAIWGPGTGAHFAWITEEIGGVWYVVGFGHQGAPDRNTLSGMNQYFASVGEPGVRYLDFSKAA